MHLCIYIVAPMYVFQSVYSRYYTHFFSPKLFAQFIFSSPFFAYFPLFSSCRLFAFSFILCFIYVLYVCVLYYACKFVLDKVHQKSKNFYFVAHNLCIHFHEILTQLNRSSQCMYIYILCVAICLTATAINSIIVLL